MEKPTPLRDLIPQDSRYPYVIETSRTTPLVGARRTARRATRAEFLAGGATIVAVLVLALLALLDFWG